MSFDWNYQQIEKVIDLYQQKPELRDMKGNNYHIKNNHNDAWLLLWVKWGARWVKLKTR